MSTWYYISNDTRLGPVEGNEMVRLIRQGSITAHTLVWREGLDGWREAQNQFAVFEGHIGPPPVPPRASDVGRTSSSIAFGVETSNISLNGHYSGSPARSFGEAVGVCLVKYVTFSGRASRSEYWYFALFLTFVYLTAATIDTFIFGFDFDADEPGPVSAITGLAFMLPSIAATVRRLHDTNRSGWWLVNLFLLPVVFIVVTMFPPIKNSWADDLVEYSFIGGLLIFLTYYISILVFTIQRGNAGENKFG